MGVPLPIIIMIVMMMLMFAVAAIIIYQKNKHTFRQTVDAKPKQKDGQL
ncbi:hypothetical protein I6G82_01835 [Lysinibacillus macroides]|nr:hypothetical protein [Lysinibacillus macroides]QPR68397.1 hypothetical protein I6G82_01835 [Lysinibacillus macroides]